MEMKAVPIYVQPSKPTPYEVIPLTPGSVMAGLNTLISTHVLVFKPAAQLDDGRRPSDIIQSGLAQLLVPYYPLAGRIVENETGWEVQCDGQGAVLIVTTAPDFEEIHVPGSRSLLKPPIDVETVVVHRPDVVDQPPSAPPSITPTLTVQITELENGGFVLAVKMYKGICDAAGFLHFLCGWAEMARGKPHVSVLPLWGNKTMRYDPSPYPNSRAIDVSGKYPNTLPTNHLSREEHAQYQVHLPNLEKGIQDSDLMYGCHHHKRLHKPPVTDRLQLDIPYEVIKALCDWILVEENYSCTTLQVLTAHVWRERTRALQVPSDEETRLFFLSKSKQDLPVSFYGSFAFNCQVMAKASDLVNLPLVYAVQLIQEAEANLVYNFTTCTDDFKQVHCSCGYTPLGVLLFTSLPTTNMDKHLDFGQLGKPLASSFDIIHFPSNVNIAALLPPSHAYESTFHIIMNNIPFVHVNELRSLLCNMPIQTSIDSKI